MCLFTPQLSLGTQIADPQKVPGSVPMWFTRPKTVTHPGTNRARRRVTKLIETNVLPLSQTAKPVRCEVPSGLAVSSTLSQSASSSSLSLLLSSIVLVMVYLTGDSQRSICFGQMNLLRCCSLSGFFLMFECLCCSACYHSNSVRNLLQSSWCNYQDRLNMTLGSCCLIH